MNTQAPNEGQLEVVQKGRLFVTSKGVSLYLVGVSPLLIAKLQSAGKLPDVPTRKLMLDFGVEDGGEDSNNFQTEELRADDLQDEEERRKWADYVRERDTVLTARNEKFLKAIFAKGVNVDMSHIQAWREEMEYFEIPVAEHPLDLKVEYIQTEALSNTQDMVDIITGVLAESGIPEEDLVEVKAMFQRSIRRDSAGEPDDTEGEVVVEPDLYGDESGALVGGLAS